MEEDTGYIPGINDVSDLFSTSTNPTIKKAAGVMQKTEQSRDAELLQKEGEISQAMETQSRNAGQRPGSPNLPEYEEPHTGVIPPIGSKNVMDWISYAAKATVVTGLIGSLIASKNASGAKLSLAAALEGWKAGDQEKKKSAMEKYKMHIDEILKQNAIEQQEYQNILYNDKLTVSEKVQQYNLAAKKWGNQLAMQAKSIKDMYTAEEAMKKNDIRLKESEQKREQLKKDTAKMKEYDKYVQETKKAGENPIRFEQWMDADKNGNLGRVVQKHRMDQLSPNQRKFVDDVMKVIKDPKYAGEKYSLDQLIARAKEKFPTE
jgi:hypothetical protein